MAGCGVHTAAGTMASEGVPNRKFAEELARYERARRPGTPEYEKRLDYPGDAARAHVCPDPECVNFEVRGKLQTYWICPACSAAAPDTIEALTHAPYKLLPTRKKRATSSAAAFSVWAMRRPREKAASPEPF